MTSNFTVRANYLFRSCQQSCLCLQEQQPLSCLTCISPAIASHTDQCGDPSSLLSPTSIHQWAVDLLGQPRLVPALPWLQDTPPSWQCWCWAVFVQSSPTRTPGDPSPSLENLSACGTGVTQPPERELGAQQPWKCRSAFPEEGKNRGENALLVSAVAFSPAGRTLQTSVMTLQFRLIFEPVLCSL